MVADAVAGEEVMDEDECECFGRCGGVGPRAWASMAGDEGFDGRLRLEGRRGGRRSYAMQRGKLRLDPRQERPGRAHAGRRVSSAAALASAGRRPFAAPCLARLCGAPISSPAPPRSHSSTRPARFLPAVQWRAAVVAN